MKVIIGNITITKGVYPVEKEPEKVWVENGTGEGMAIDEKILADALEEFFNKYF